jgi:hypothetical protein
MPIPSGSSIRLSNGHDEWIFTWTGFDLDDCFDLFKIAIRNKNVGETYELGSCVVSGLRRLTRFFDSGLSEDVVGGGFRNPDPRFYELRRNGGRFSLLIQFPEKNLKKEFVLSATEVAVDREFLAHYDGGDEIDLKDFCDPGSETGAKN